jgi:HK97 family phage prohead protease
MAERRIVAAPALRLETRETEDGSKFSRIVGHASVFDQWTTLYEGRYWTWREIVRPGAYARAIKEKQDVRALFNHDSNFILGRTISGTLTLREDETGLMTETDPPANQTIQDLVLAPIARKDVTGMSFAFAVPKRGDRTFTEKDDGSEVMESPFERVTIRYEGERLIEERELLDVDLYDISPVVYPAYEGTDVAMRSRPDFNQLIAERDRPHKRKAPRRDEIRRWLESSARAGGVGV